MKILAHQFKIIVIKVIACEVSKVSLKNIMIPFVSEK